MVAAQDYFQRMQLKIQGRCIQFVFQKLNLLFNARFEFKQFCRLFPEFGQGLWFERGFCLVGNRHHLLEGCGNHFFQALVLQIRIAAGLKTLKTLQGIVGLQFNLSSLCHARQKILGGLILGIQF